jgi:hypothetical protein
MRRALAIAAPLLLASCHFTVSRSLGPGEIRGTVVFQGTGSSTQPAGGAHVVLENSSTSVDADSRGAFVIGNLPPGTYALTITASQAGNGVADSGIRLQNITLASTTSGFGDGRDLGRIVIGAFGGIAGQITVMGEAPSSAAAAVLTAISQANANAAGSFTFNNLPSGDYDLTAVVQETPALISNPMTVHVNPRLTTTVPAIDLSSSMAATMGSLQGQARLAGQAAGMTSIDIQLASPGVMQSSLPSVSTNDVAGDYIANPIPAGIYTVTAEVGGYESVTVPFIVVASQTTFVPAITLAPIQGGLPDGGTESDSERVHEACENASACGGLGPNGPFSTEMQCEQAVGGALESLAADQACATSAADLREVADCIATAPCTEFGSGQVCSVPLQAFSTDSQTDPTCASIAQGLFGQSSQPDGGMGDGGTPDGGSGPGWIIEHAEPSVRQLAGMVYDGHLQEVLVLGGFTGAGTPLPITDGVIWAWPITGSSPAWQRLNPTGETYGFDWTQSVIYDVMNDRLVVFTNSADGSGSNIVALVTIDASGNANWTTATTSGAPPLRAGATFTYDQVHQRAYLFGGVESGSIAVNEVWTLSLPTTGTLVWQNVTPVGNSPVQGRDFSGGAVSPRDGTLYIVGGGGTDGQNYADAWAFQAPASGAGTWSSATSATLSGAVSQSPIAYVQGSTAASDVLMYFGVQNFANQPNTTDFEQLNVGAGASAATWTDVTQTANGGPDLRSEASFCEASGAPGSPTFYVFGGIDQFLQNDLYDLTTPDQGTTWVWQRLAQPHDEFEGASAIALANGNVFLWGGEDASRVNSDFSPLQGTLYESTSSISSAWIPASQPSTSPTERTNAATVFDSHDSTMVIFGGDLGLGDTWSLNPTFPPTWTELSDGLTDSPGPSPTRSVVSSAYDVHNLQMIVFGGAVDNGQGPGATPNLLNDTWVFGLSATPGPWTQLTFPQQEVLPGPRAGATAVFDVTNSRMILMGGFGAAGTLSDSWSLDLSNGNGNAAWTELQTTGWPGIAQAAAVYDGPNNRIFVFGGGLGGIGANTKSYSSQLWSLQLDQTPMVWTQLCPGGALQPYGRAGAIFLALPSAFFLYGGTVDPLSPSNGIDNMEYGLALGSIPACTP